MAGKIEPRAIIRSPAVGSAEPLGSAHTKRCRTKRALAEALVGGQTALIAYQLGDRDRKVIPSNSKM